MTNEKLSLHPSAEGVRLVHGLWVDRWDAENYPGEPAPDLDVVRLWIDGLRRPGLRRTTRALTNVLSDGTETYCCLGVLCEIAVEKGKTVKHEVGSRRRDVAYGPAGASMQDGTLQWAVLPYEVMEWLGANRQTVEVSRVKQLDIALESDGEIPRIHEQIDGASSVMATELNDVMNMTFAQIADVLEYRYFGIEPKN